MDHSKVTDTVQLNSQLFNDQALTESCSYGYPSHGYPTLDPVSTVTLSGLDLNGTSLTSPYTFSSGPYTATGTVTGASLPNVTWTGTGFGSNNGATWLNSNPTGTKIQLDGENADVTVNGWSLVAAVKRIEERLGLYQPNPELEREWSELRDLAEQYRNLEQHIKDKQATFDRLKAMPAPEID